jgi:prepilin peptidase CpaA
MEHNIITLYSVTFSFAILLIVAAISDAWKFVIPNFISIGVFILFFIAALILPFETHWLSHLGIAGATFAVGLLMYRFQLLGAGDVKLMTAVSLWCGVDHILWFILYMAVAGGALAVGLVLLRYLIVTIQLQTSNPGAISIPRVFRIGESVPYGLAIAVGSLSLVYELPHLLLHA